MNVKVIYSVSIIKVIVLALTQKLMSVHYPRAILVVQGILDIAQTLVNVSMGKEIAIQTHNVKMVFASCMLGIFLGLHPMLMSV